MKVPMLNQIKTDMKVKKYALIVVDSLESDYPYFITDDKGHPLLSIRKKDAYNHPLVKKGEAVVFEFETRVK